MTVSETLRENLRQAKDLFLMLWYHGTFPLSLMTYGFIGGMVAGFAIGRVL
jgi:hypothetical protein